jgi:3-oxoacyl-[acyl-carrier-protein] synthase II
MKMAIRGVGAIGGFGVGISDLEEFLKDRDLLSNKNFPCQLNHHHSPSIFSAKTEKLETFIPKKRLRRMDHFSKMALLAAFSAMQDAGASIPLGYDTGIILASGYGSTRSTFSFLDSVIDHGDRCGSPTHFSNSVHNSAAANISIVMQGVGPNTTVSQFEMSLPAAFALARIWLAEDRVTSVLIGGADEHSPVLEYSWSRFFSQHPSLLNQSLDAGRRKFSIGEGAVFFLLSKPDRNPSPYGFIESIQMGNLNREAIAFPGNTVIIIDTDNCATHPRYYREIIPRELPVQSYTSIFGSSPVGMSFDMAVACLILKKNISESVCCLKITRQKEYGFISMTRYS